MDADGFDRRPRCDARADLPIVALDQPAARRWRALCDICCGAEVGPLPVPSTRPRQVTRVAALSAPLPPPCSLCGQQGLALYIPPPPRDRNEDGYVERLRARCYRALIGTDPL